MAATLRLYLILDVYAGGAGFGETPHRARENQGRSESRVGIHQQWQWAGVGDPAHVLGHVVEGCYTQIGQAERCVGNAGAGEVDGAEAYAFGKQRAVGVDGAGDLQRPFVIQCGSKADPRWLCGRHRLSPACARPGDRAALR